MGKWWETAGARQGKKLVNSRPEKLPFWYKPTIHEFPRHVLLCKNLETLSYIFTLEIIKKFPEGKWYDTFFRTEAALFYLPRQTLIGIPIIMAFGIHQSVLEWGLLLSLVCFYLLSPLTIIELYT